MLLILSIIFKMRVLKHTIYFGFSYLKFNTLRHHSRILSNMQCMNMTLVERKKTLVVKGNLNVSYLF